MRDSLLVVEDEPQLSRSLSRALTREGYDVSVAERCADALVLARSLESPCVCAVLDIELPDGTGIELGKTLLAEGHVHHLLFFSGSADLKHRTEAQSLGSFIPKSAGLEGLRAALTELNQQSGELPAANTTGCFAAARMGGLAVKQTKCS